MKMALSISVFFLGLVPISSYYMIAYFEQEMKNSIVQQQTAMINREAEDLDHKFGMVHDILIEIARNNAPAAIFAGPAAAQQFIDSRLALKAMFGNGIYCFTPDGILIAETMVRPPRVGADFSYRDYLKQPLASRRPLISAPYISSQPHHHPSVMFTAPVLNRDGSTAGILGGSLDLMRPNFIGDLARTRIGKSGYYYLIDEHRTLIMHPDPSRIMKSDAPLGSNLLLDRAFSGFEGGGETVNSRRVPMLTSFRRLKTTGWILAANLPQKEAYAGIRRTERGIWLFIAAFGLLQACTVWLLTSRLASPLLSLTRQVRDIKGLDKVQVTTSDEIGDLAEAFNRQLELIRDNERTLLQERELFQTLADFSSNWVFWRAENGYMRYNSPACEKVSGYTAAELTGRPSLAELMIHPDDLARWRDHAHLADSRGNPFPMRFRIITKSGEQRWIDHVCLPIHDADGRFLGTRGSNRDITEQMAAEESLAKSEARFRRLFERNASVMLLIEPDSGIIVDANPSAADFYGYPLSELIGLSIDRINTLDPKEVELQRQRAARGERSYFTFRHRLANGEFRIVEVYSTPIADEGKPLLVSIVHDITERKRGEKELHEQQAMLRREIEERQNAQATLHAQRRQLEELNRSLEERIAQTVAELRQKDQVLISQNRQAAMGEMIGNIAHQWRQPLNALGLLLANIKDAQHYQELDEPYLERSIAEGNRLIQKMSATINDFRDFFNPGKEAVAFAARQQIAQAIALVESSFKNSGIELRLEADREVYLTGFPNEYSQVLLNLVSNARDAIVSRGNQPGSIVIRLSESDGRGCVTVTDNGGGIPLPSMDRIFEPYFSTKEMGTGIGLYMSQMIIERNMGGSISARNVAGGAEFTVITPLAKGEP